eukprot:m51a1_g5809 putative adenylate guanylate cyclase (715) ;mRNA; r:140096-142331
MAMSFRALLVASVCTAVWIPLIVVVVVFKAHTLSLSRRSTEELLPPTAVRLAAIVDRSLGRAEKVGKLAAYDLSSGSLVFDETARGLRELRVRWDSALVAHASTSSVQFITAEGRLFGLLEARGAPKMWWWTAPNGTLERWRLDSATLEPLQLELVYPAFGADYLPRVRDALPEGAELCWMPVYSMSGTVWTSFVVVARTAESSGSVWAYAIVDLVVQDLDAALAGLPVGDGLAVLVDSSSSTLLGSTSAAVPVYRVGDDGATTAIPVGETNGTSVDERRVAAVNALVVRKYGSWHALSLTLGDSYAEPSPAVSVAVGGATALVSFTLVRRACLSWVVAVVEAQQSDPVDAVPVAVSLCAGLLALAALAALSIGLTRPLGRLSREMDAAARLAFSEKRVDISAFSEFQRLNDSFAQLNAGIVAMTRYVPMPVVSKIMSSSAPAAGDSGLVSVAMKRVTIMFCDIGRFSELAETLRAKAVVQMLSEWLGAYTKVIVRNNGVVDKYVGDCIMALWNAPLDTENPDAKACAAALEFEGALGALNRRFEGDGLPGLRVRVGIHTGELLVGNIGCEDHVNYTVCGTPANTSARIEQLGKVYGLSPLVSGDVARAVGAQYVCVWLDELKLRGHESTVTSVFHLAARTTEAKPSHLIAAETMEAIQELLHSGLKSSTAELEWRLQEALSNPEMVEYYTALRLIQDRIANREEMLDTGLLNH